GRRRRPHEHLPRRTLPTHRQTPRQRQGTRGRGPLHAHHHLAPASRPQHHLQRPRRRLLHQPHPPTAQDQKPHPPTRGTRLQRHPRHRITHTPHPKPTTPTSALTHAHHPVIFRSG